MLFLILPKNERNNSIIELWQLRDPNSFFYFLEESSAWKKNIWLCLTFSRRSWNFLFVSYNRRLRALDFKNMYCQILEILFGIFLHSLNIPCAQRVSEFGRMMRSFMSMEMKMMSDVFRIINPHGHHGGIQTQAVPIGFSGGK